MDVLDTFLALFWILFLAGRLLGAVDPPPSHPSLSIHPPYNSFLLEQCFSLTCSPPQNQTVYYFHETTTDGAWVLMKTQSGNTLKVCIRHLETEKKYACHYMEGNNGGLQNKSSSLSNEITISILDRLPAPILSLDPHQPVYNPGQQVRLICSASEWPQLAEYQVHYKDLQYETEFRKIYVTSENMRQHNMVVEKDTAGEYRCQYWIILSGRKIFSPWSKLASVAMTDPPPAPILDLDPQQPVYVHGEPVRLICSAPEGLEVAGYTFYSGRLQDFRDVKEINRTCAKTGQYQLIVEERTAGEYSCLSWTVVSGREILSPWSNSVSVAVTDPPPAPTLVLDPQQPVYVHGEPVRLICSAPEGLEVAGYTFYSGRLQDVKDVKEMNGTNAKTGQYQLIVEERTAGEYSCLSWTVVSGREILSPWSNSVSVARA
ncbi:uncharacterized protein LOC112542642, partial [Python bivittatus]|uniref:Uncharacterized protein LOC112542642 n=1 Tax=Python bivittatus TaxID=176946 RepID=A0A9F5N0X2_PYTBI